jgi:hypothetical protein
MNMKKLSYLFAAAAMSGLALMTTPSSAAPLTGGLIYGSTAIPQIDEGLVQKVHGWHCRKRWSSYRGWHRHRRACYDDDYYGYGYPGYGLGVAPFFSFQFFDDDDHRHGRKHRFKRRRHKD